MAYTSEIDKLERRHRENPEGRTFAPLADAYRKAGDVARALEILKTGLQLHPDYLSASIVLGRCHLDLGDLASAESAFRRVLELDKENVIAIKALADITERQGRLDESEHWLNYLLSIDGSNEEARGQLQRLSLAREQEPVSTDTPSEAAAVAQAEPMDLEQAEPKEVFSFADIDTVEIVPLMEPAPSMAAEPPEWAPAGKTEEVVAIHLSPEPLPTYETSATGDDHDLVGVSDEQAAPSPHADEPESASTGGADHFEFGVVRAEEIVLRPSFSTEYQEPSDSEVLGGARSSGGFAASFGEPVPVPTPAAEETPESDAADESLASGGLWQSHPEDATAVESGAIEPLSSESLGEELPAVASASPAGTEDSAQSPGAWEPPALAAAESSAGWNVPTVEEEAVPALASTWREDDELDDGEDASEPEQLVTETMGDVYAAQGHHAEALHVYRQLLVRSPDDPRLQEKIERMERRRSSEPAPTQRGYGAAQTGGQSVLSYFGDLLSARLNESSNGSPEEPAPGRAGRDSEPVATNYMEEAFRTDAEGPVSGEPTRPASGPLSLSAIFGEDSSPVPPVVAGPGGDNEPKKAGSSFDEFFGERAPAAAGTTRTRSVRTDADEDDLEQFHKWLKGLKR